MKKHYLAVLALFLSLPTAFVRAQTDKKISVSLIYEAIAATNATLWFAALAASRVERTSPA